MVSRTKHLPLFKHHQHFLNAKYYNSRAFYLTSAKYSTKKKVFSLIKPTYIQNLALKMCGEVQTRVHGHQY